jgi:thioredoxin-like negative regulator of GroEL
MSSKLPLITEISSINAFQDLLAKNPGLIIIKFGATWCGPCKKIEPLIDKWFEYLPGLVQCCKIDVDESIELYGFLKSKRRINGIPAVMCYYQGNLNYIPNDMIAGADVDQNNAFFQRCLQRLDLIKAAAENVAQQSNQEQAPVAQP